MCCRLIGLMQHPLAEVRLFSLFSAAREVKSRQLQADTLGPAVAVTGIILNTQ